MLILKGKPGDNKYQWKPTPFFLSHPGDRGQGIDLIDWFHFSSAGYIRHACTSFFVIETSVSIEIMIILQHERLFPFPNIGTTRRKSYNTYTNDFLDRYERNKNAPRIAGTTKTLLLYILSPLPGVSKCSSSRPHRNRTMVLMLRIPAAPSRQIQYLLHGQRLTPGKGEVSRGRWIIEALQEKRKRHPWTTPKEETITSVKKLRNDVGMTSTLSESQKFSIKRFICYVHKKLKFYDIFRVRVMTKKV